MREKEGVRDKREYVQKRKKSQKKSFIKRKDFQHVMDVGTSFIDLLKKYEYEAK